jgi:hypothetical protein
MSLNLFLEDADFEIRGAYNFSPKHAISSLDANIEAVYFPYMINGGFLNSKMQKFLLKFVPEDFLGTRFEYEYTNGQVPLYLCQMYRKHLKKKFPSLQNKPIVFLHIADFPFQYNTNENIIIVRCSVNRATMQKNDIIMPSRVSYEDWIGPQKEIKETIGFCGYPNTHPTRKKLIEELERSNSIKLDMYLTSMFFFHINETIKKNTTNTQKEVYIKQTKEDLKKEFNQRLQRNIFSLCPRGRGHYSRRFYETLRAGRIPVMIDTGQVFPLEDIIDWDDIVICAKNTEELIHKVQDWTKNRDLIEIQKRCREVWETYLHFPKFLEFLPIYIKKSMQ